MANKSKKKNTSKKVKKVEKSNTTMISNNELINLLKIILIICAVLLIFYFITVLVQNKKEDNNSNSDTVAVIQYDKILVGQILNRSENDYYVLVEKKEDPYIDLYKQYLNNVKDITYYSVDLSEIFNQNNIGEETIVEGNEISNYRFAGTTLIKVTNNTISGVYKNKDEIVAYLGNL